MNKLSRLLVLILMIAVLEPARSQTKPAAPVSTAALENPLFRHLPPNAEEVYQVNLPAITAKVGWEEMVSGLPFLQKADYKGIELAILKDPSRAGVDIHKDIFFAISNKGAYNMVSFTTWLIHLTDSGKLVSFLRSNTKGMKFTKYPGKGRGTANDKFAIAWNKDLVVLAVATMPKNSDAAPKPADVTALAVKQSLAALQGYDQSKFITDMSFRTAFADDADLHIWGSQGTSISTMMDAVTKGKHAAPMTISPGMKKTKVISSLRFENGKVTMRSLSTLPQEQENFYEKYHPRPLNTDLLTHIPKGDLLGFFDLHIDLPAIVAVLDQNKVRGKIDSALAKKELSVDDVVRAFKGDFLLTVSRPLHDDSTEQSIKPIFAFATTIGDPLALMKIAKSFSMLKDSLGKPSGNDADNSTDQSNPLSKLKTAYTLRDNILVVSGSKESADAWFTIGEKRNTDFISPRMQDNPVTFFVDFKTLTNYLQRVMHTDASSPNNQQTMVSFLHALDNLTITAGKLDGTRMESYFEIKMADASTNSLRTIVNLLKK